MAYYVQWLFGRLIELLGYLFFGLRIEGTENLKKCELPVIFVPNHKSWIDHFIIIAGGLRRRGVIPVHVLAADDIYKIPVVGTICWALGAYPARYGSGLEISLAPLLKEMAKGESTGLYPEAGITKGYGEFKNPKPGAAWLALKTGRQLLPMAIKGLENFTWSSLFFGRRSVTLRIGEPFRLQGSADNPDDVARGTELIMARIKSIYFDIPDRKGIPAEESHYAAQ